MRTGSPQLISDILKGVVEELSQAKKKGIAKVFAVWPRVAGRELSRHTRPARLQRGTLLINVDESAWLYQANLKKDVLLKALQKKIEREKIQQIQFRIGKAR